MEEATHLVSRRRMLAPWWRQGRRFGGVPLTFCLKMMSYSGCLRPSSMSSGSFSSSTSAVDQISFGSAFGFGVAFFAFVAFGGPIIPGVIPVTFTGPSLPYDAWGGALSALLNIESSAAQSCPPSIATLTKGFSVQGGSRPLTYYVAYSWDPGGRVGPSRSAATVVGPVGLA